MKKPKFCTLVVILQVCKRSLYPNRTFVAVVYFFVLGDSLLHGHQGSLKFKLSVDLAFLLVLQVLGSLDHHARE